MLDPKQIQALSAVVREGSFQGAARALNLTPAAITQRIKALEATIGATVLVRGKALRVTPKGQAILAYTQKSEWLDQELMRNLNLDSQTFHGRTQWRTLRVAINADSLATWFLPGVADAMKQQHLLLDLVIDDQDHTHQALRTGEVMGCVTTLAAAMPGCLAEPLGVMRYRALATPDIINRVQRSTGRVSVHRLLAQPAVIFNRKDAIHDRFLKKHLDLQSPLYPKHFVPALDAFEAAIDLGLGWGMVPDALRVSPPMTKQTQKQTPKLQEIIPGCHLDVQLYWQHWQQEPPHGVALTQAVKLAAKQGLMQLGTV